MIPGEIITQSGEIELNTGRESLNILVENQGDRPIQVGSHFHFLEVNSALAFFQIDQKSKNIIPIDRSDANNPTRGMRLNIPAGTAVRFEPGDEKQVELVSFGGLREIYGFNGLVNSQL